MENNEINENATPKNNEDAAKMLRRLTVTAIALGGVIAVLAAVLTIALVLKK